MSRLAISRDGAASAQDAERNSTDDKEGSDDDADGDSGLSADSEAIAAVRGSSGGGRGDGSSGLGKAGRAGLGRQVEFAGGNVEAGDLDVEGGGLDKGLSSSVSLCKAQGEGRGGTERGTDDISTGVERLVATAQLGLVLRPVLELNGGIGARADGAGHLGDLVALVACLDGADVACYLLREGALGLGVCEGLI